MAVMEEVWMESVEKEKKKVRMLEEVGMKGIKVGGSIKLESDNSKF